MTENIVYTESAIAYETEYYEDETLEVGETREVVAGVDGTMREAWQVTYEDGEIVSQTLVESTVVTEPTNRVVLTHTDRSIHEHDAVVVGDVTSSTISEEAASTLPENAIVTASGEVYTYSSVLTCTATAYTGGGTTASGTAARVGEVAVDPKVIPLGSILYIVSDDGYCIYGYCVAEDTGGLIKGKRVDLYMDTYTEAINFGCRSVTVYILDPA
jgi:3D (Asp-Asp-Asp) domain-containing protein